jgi:hypothetical protein
MIQPSNSRAAISSRRLPRTRTKHNRRQSTLECLESRTLLAYTFTGGGTPVGTATGDASGDTLYLQAIGGFIEHSTDNVTYSADWGGGLMIAAATANTININQGPGPATHAVVLGGTTAPASALQATINVNNGGASYSLVVDDSTDATQGVYTISASKYTGPTLLVNVVGFMGLGRTLLGGTQNNTFNITSTFSGEPDTVTGNAGSDTFNVQSTSSDTTLNTGAGDDTVNVFASGNAPLNIHGQSGTDTVTLGGSTVVPLGMQGLHGTINIDNAAGSTNLVLDDSQDTTARTATLSNDGTNGQVTGVSPATIHYVNSGTDSLTVHGGSGGNTFTVNGTLVNAGVPNTPTTLDKGSGPNNTVNVTATTAGTVLNLTGSGTPDTVKLGAGLAGTVNINEAPGSTNLVLDLSGDGLPHNFTLSSDGTTSTLHDALGNAKDITYVTASLASFTLDTSANADETLNVDFSKGGNPIPTASAAGLIFNAGADFGNMHSHALNILGTLPSGAFTSETHNANDETVFPQIGQYGSIFFTDSTGINTGLNYTGTLPINDTAGAVTYTFNDFADDQSFTATSTTIGATAAVQFANTPVTPPPTFETTNLANKTNIIFIAPDKGKALKGVVNIPTPSAGLATLTFNTPGNADNTVSVIATPPGVATALNGGPEEDVTNVTGKGVAAGTTLTLNGGLGTNTLNYDAGGLVPTVTAGGNPGEVLISLPGFGTVDATNYQTVHITNTGPVTITPGAAATIIAREGHRVTDALVGTFTLPLPAIGTAPAGLPASDFTATIDWADPSPDLTAGTITQDASNPSVYDVTGTHTFVEQGTFAVASTLAFSGATFTSTVNGVAVSLTLPPAGPTAGTPATATVIQGVLGVSVFPLVGTEGVPTPAGPIATFVDAGGANPVSDYSAMITIIDSSGATVASVPAASITQNGTAASYTVNAPPLTFPETGTYQVVVAVTDSDTPSPLTVPGAATAVIADAKLAASATQPTVSTPEAQVFSVPTFGKPLFNGPVASFTDANTIAPTTDFSATIDWGDGTAPSIGVITQPGGVGTAFLVTGAHTYADSGVNVGAGVPAGTYNIQVFVQDVDGSKLNLTNTATVTDNPIVLSGRLNPASDSGKFNNDGITNVTEPNFFGTSEPFSHVALFANGTLIGAAQTGSDGSWSITSTHLADGAYLIQATAVDQFGVTTTAAPVTITPRLLIDTVGPRITFAAFDRLTGTEFYTFQDFLQNGTTPGGSGLLIQSLSDAANYYLNRVHAPKVLGRYIVTDITVTPGTDPFSQDVAVVFNNGAFNKGGYFRIIAHAASLIFPSGIQDLAGNALDGEFYGQQSASGNGVPGGDFVANVKAFHQNTPGFGYSGPLTILGFPHPNDPAGNFPPTTKKTKTVRVHSKTPHVKVSKTPHVKVATPRPKTTTRHVVKVTRSGGDPVSAPMSLAVWYQVRAQLTKQAGG